MIEKYNRKIFNSCSAVAKCCLLRIRDKANIMYRKRFSNETNNSNVPYVTVGNWKVA